MALLVAGHHFTIGPESKAIGRAKSGANNLGGFPIGAHLHDCAVLSNDRWEGMPATLGVVKIPFGVRLQIHREFMEMLGDLMVVVEALVEIGFAIAVEVIQPGDLIAAA